MTLLQSIARKNHLFAELSRYETIASRYQSGGHEPPPLIADKVRELRTAYEHALYEVERLHLARRNGQAEQ